MTNFLSYNLTPFQKARLQLTGWYILIIACLLIIFSAAAVNAERKAFNRIEQALSDPIQRPKLTALLEKRVSEFDLNFKYRLLTFDILLFLTAAIASYFLSGRTLRPIQQMIKEQEEFSADASHELRTPLTTISMEIEALKRTEKNIPTKYQSFFNSVQEEIYRMRNIVDGLLILVRSNYLDSPADGHNFLFDDLIKDAFKQMQPLAEEKKIGFKLETEENLSVFGSKDAIKPVIIILMDNAIKYTPSGKEVRIDVKRSNNFIQLSVIDMGIGISEKDLPHIFDRFYRVAQKDESFTKGAGLGLAIAKKIVGSYGGEILVESKLGEGSKFIVSLPKSLR